MRKSYRVTFMVRLINSLGRFMTKRGLNASNYYLLTVRGRKTGRLYTAPVILIEEDGKRWLVSPYGDVQWVRNARAAGEVTLSRAGHSETMKIAELDGVERASIIKKYTTLSAFTRPYFKVPPNAPVESFIEEGAFHPVFALKA
jgi:deazaflavin-dependent oxidoreductase (nitroreductase family)